MSAIVLAPIFLAVLLSATAGGEAIDVPAGGSVTPDGTFAPDEWSDAAARRLAGDVDLLVKRDDASLYLALRFGEQKHSGLDLYLADPDGTRRLFHISSELGTKRWSGGTWGDYDWEVAGWTGNPVEFEIRDDGLSIHEPDGFELRLGLDRLRNDGLDLHALRVSFRLKRPDLTVPPGADEAALEQWIELRVETP
jgi:hypothetical protein